MKSIAKDPTLKTGMTAPKTTALVKRSLGTQQERIPQ